MTVYVAVTHGLIGDSLFAVAFEMAAAVAVYALTFLFGAITATERRLYISKVYALIGTWLPIATVPERA
jgi:hypothetical protein